MQIPFVIAPRLTVHFKLAFDPINTFERDFVLHTLFYTKWDIDVKLILREFI